MKAHVAVDSLPQFKGLNLRSSHLMIAAKAHLAKGEPFEAAVRWVEAGRALTDLARALSEEGYAYAATQDALSAVHCYLEAGDYRPAEANLERLDDLAQLREVLASDAALRREHVELKRWRDSRRDALEKAQAEALRQMGKPGQADRLRDEWLNRVLADMPGVPELHWLMARKDTLRNRVQRAIDHYRLCCRLKPDHYPYHAILLHQLQTWRLWDQARAEGERALAKFPQEPLVRFYIGWGLVLIVVNGRAPKRALIEAKESFDWALKHSDQMTGMQNVCVACSLSLCMARLGETRDAERVLRWAVREWPSPASDLAWELLGLRPAQRERRVLERVRKLDLVAA
jgi:tetratricopeptide (TPR) repeat protein